MISGARAASHITRCTGRPATDRRGYAKVRGRSWTDDLGQALRVLPLSPDPLRNAAVLQRRCETAWVSLGRACGGNLSVCPSVYLLFARPSAPGCDWQLTVAPCTSNGDASAVERSLTGWAAGSKPQCVCPGFVPPTTFDSTFEGWGRVPAEERKPVSYKNWGSRIRTLTN